MRIDIFVITRGGVAHARNMATGFARSAEDCRIWFLKDYAAADDFPAGVAAPFKGMAAKVAEIFEQTDAIIMVCAVGIAVRMIAPLLEDKRKDPAVIAVDDAGRFAVSILSGHIGGANDLTRIVAAILDAMPVITTATDVNGIPAFDALATHYGMEMLPFAMVKAGNAAMVAGKPVRIYTDYDFPVEWPENVDISPPPKEPLALQAGFVAAISCRKLGGAGYLQLVPKIIHAGIGCRRGVGKDELLGALRAAMGMAGLRLEALAEIASIDVKSNEAGLLQAVSELDVPIRFFPAQELAEVAGCSASGFVQATVGCPSVCEAAAVLAAGPGSMLLLKKTIIDKVTVALAAQNFPNII